MNARQEWLTRRQQGLGGSDVAAILGLSPWKTPLDVYLSKVEPVEDDGLEDMSEPALWGTLLEEVVAKEASRRAGYQIQRINGLAKHPKHSVLVANLDRVIVAPGSRARLDTSGRLLGAAGIMEVKTASAYKAGEWGRPDDDEAIPIHYAAQGMHYLSVTGQEWCEFAVLIGGQRFVTKRMERDEPTIAAMAEQCVAFWENHVLPRRPPEPVNSADVLKMFPKDNAVAIDASANALHAFNEAKRLREQIKVAETDLESHTEALKLALGPNVSLTLDGKPIVTWKAAADSKKTDWKAAFEEIQPLYEIARSAEAMTAAEILQRHTASAPGSRRFLFK